MYVLNNDGNAVPAGICEWTAFIADETQRVVASSRVEDSHIMTYFNGIPDWREQVVFETLVFSVHHGLHHYLFWTRPEAVRMHGEILAALREGRPLPACVLVHA